MKYDLREVKRQGYQIVGDIYEDDNVLYFINAASPLFINDKKIIEIMQKEADQHGVYTPTKQSFRDYEIAIFYDAIEMLEDLYDREIKQAIRGLKTPEEYGRDKMLNTEYITGEEMEMVRRMESFIRESSYHFAIHSIYGMFYHFLCSVTDKTLFEAAIKHGYKDQYLSKKALMSFWRNELGFDMRKSNYYKNYDELSALWNLMKHNSEQAYNKLKKISPSMIKSDKFEAGSFYFSHIIINEGYISDTLDNLKMFFKDLVEHTFGEDVDRAIWDQGEYFAEQIDFFNNPLGISWYL